LIALVDLGALSTFPFKFSAVSLPVFNVSPTFFASSGRLQWLSPLPLLSPDLEAHHALFVRLLLELLPCPGFGSLPLLVRQR